jgi:hypothetical protein
LTVALSDVCDTCCSDSGSVDARCNDASGDALGEGSGSFSADGGSSHRAFSVGSVGDGDNGASLWGVVDDGKNGVLKNLEDSNTSRADSKEQGEGRDFSERHSHRLLG